MNKFLGEHETHFPCCLIKHEDGMKIKETLERNNNSFVSKKIKEKTLSLLVVSSEAYAGLSENDAKSIESGSCNYIYFLRYGLGNNPNSQPQDVLKRFEKFFKETEKRKDGPPNWELLAPPSYPESLLSAYIVLIAQKKAQSEALDFKSNDIRLNGEIWEDACKKFHALKGEKISNELWQPPSDNNIEKRCNDIRELLMKINTSQKNTMLTPWNIHCEADAIRGKLRHHWLENQIKPILPEYIINKIWLKGAIWIEERTQFDSFVQKAKELAENMEQGFSPSQLVDQLPPLLTLPQNARSIIKEAVHETYLENSDMLELKKSLKKSIKIFEQALSEFRKAWLLPRPDEKKQVYNAFVKMQERAMDLLQTICLLPKGVVFP